MATKLIPIGLFILMICISYGFTVPAEEKREAEKQTVLESARNISQEGAAAILKRSCAISGCHRGEYPKAKLNLEPEKMYAATANVESMQIESLKLIDTSNPEASYLLMKIRGDEGIKNNRMPINAPPLKEDEIRTVRLWIHVLHIMNSE